MLSYVASFFVSSTPATTADEEFVVVENAEKITEQLKKEEVTNTSISK